jgi:hypothetical protein
MDIMELAYLCVDMYGGKGGKKVLLIVTGVLDYGEAFSRGGHQRRGPRLRSSRSPSLTTRSLTRLRLRDETADVVITSFSSPVTSNQFVHTKGVKDALDAGMRWGTFTPPPPGSRGVTAKDLFDTRDRAYRLAERLTKAESARVTTALGTEVVMSLREKVDRHLPHLSRSSPTGRWAAMPLFSSRHLSGEDSAEGLAVIDG